MSSQPFLVLDRNLIVIMSIIATAPLKALLLFLEQVVTIASHLNQFYTILTTIFYSVIIYYALLPERSVTPSAAEDSPC